MTETKISEQPDGFVALGLRLGVLLLGYVLLERWLLAVAQLPETAYQQPVIALELLTKIVTPARWSIPYVVKIGVLVALFLVAIRHGSRLFARWSALTDGSMLRVVVCVPTCVLAWTFSTYDYNHYFNQAHAFDRIALAILAGLCLWRPVFALPTALMAIALIWQFNYPIGGYSVAQPYMLVRLLALFIAYWFTIAARLKLRSADLLFLSFVLLASGYFSGGLGKIRIDWISLGNVGLLLPATYANGWLGFLSPDTLALITTRLLSADWLLVAGTMLVECGALFCLIRRRAFLGFLGLWICFHVSVFALTGIFFWQWMIVEFTLLWLMLVQRDAAAFRVFSVHHVVLSVPLIAVGTIIFKPVNLSWHNASVTYTYRFDALDRDGNHSSLPPEFFAPYDYQFTLGSFGYISNRRQLPVAWGAVGSKALAEAMGKAHTSQDVAALETSEGQIVRDELSANRLSEFLKKFVGSYNERQSRWTRFSLFAAPRQLWAFRRPDALTGHQRIVRVTASQVVSIFDGRSYIEMSPVELLAVDIP